MYQRTTVMLDEESLRAARELSTRLNVSTSEAIRRAIVGYRDQLTETPTHLRRERRRMFEELIEAFQGHDPAEEVRRLKEEDEGF